jgi:hypothetical protein
LPHGQGFAAKANWNRAGNQALPDARLIVTLPDSNGCLKDSNVWLENSGVSSRKRTPLWAIEMSPGLGTPDPPPIIATIEEL